MAWIPPPQEVSTWSVAAPSVEANAIRVRRQKSRASAWTMRASVRIASDAPARSESLSAKPTPNGSSSTGLVHVPRAGGASASGAAGPAGSAAATSSARASARWAPAGVGSSSAAKPQAPPTRTRTPTPADSAASTRSTAPLRTRIRSLRRSTRRASA